MKDRALQLSRPARAESLVDQIATSLRNAVLDGSLKPGQRLRQEQLASDLGVSRTPLREAMRKLEEEGLIQILPSRGAHVARLDAAEQAAFYEVREALDGLAARLAAQHIQPEQTTELQRILDAMSAHVEKDEQIDWHSANLRFHQVIYEASGNAPLLRIFSQIRVTELTNPMTSEIYRPRRELSLLEHREICAAILGGDQQSAESAARAHMQSARQTLLSHSRRQDGD